MNTARVKWKNFVNEKGNNIPKQHAFKQNASGGNYSFCGRYVLSNCGERSIDFSKIKPDKFNKDNACKTCLRASLKH